MPSAVLVVDMQVDYFAHARLARNRAELAANVNELTRLARAHDVPPCIRSTVVDAYQRDLDVIRPLGCFDSHDAEHHEISLRYMKDKLATVRDLQSIKADFGSDLVHL